MTPTMIIIATFIIIAITALFLTAINWGYQVKQSVDPITHHDHEQTTEVKK